MYIIQTDDLEVLSTGFDDAIEAVQYAVDDIKERGLEILLSTPPVHQWGLMLQTYGDVEINLVSGNYFLLSVDL